MDHLESAWTPKVRHHPRQVSPTSDVGQKSGHSQATCTLDQLATNSGVPSTLLRLDNSLEWLKKDLYLVLHGYKVHLGFSIRSQTNFFANPILHLHHEVYTDQDKQTHTVRSWRALNSGPVPSFHGARGHYHPSISVCIPTRNRG